MSEKDEVLQQISEIKSHLIDKEIFYPYNYNACYVWSSIAVVLTLVMIPAYEYSLMLGTLVMFCLLTLGFMVEGFLIKKENENYDLEDCTKNQTFIMKNFVMLSLFGVVMSSILATQGLYTLIFLLWLFLISLGHFSVGFVLNIRSFSRMAQFNVAMVLVLLLIGQNFNLFTANSLFFTTLTQIAVIVGLAILPSFLAYKQQAKEVSSV